MVALVKLKLKIQHIDFDEWNTATIGNAIHFLINCPAYQR
jgi:hypothetical protein